MLEKKFLTFLLCLVVVVSFSAAGARGADILFISSMQEQHMPGDEPLKAFMEGLGHTVTYLAANQDEATTEAAAAAADMVFISESCGSGQIKNEITEVEVPIIVGEAWAWDEMGLTEGGGADEDAVTTEIEIVDPVHYLSAGLTGTVTIFTGTTGDLGICQPGKGIAGAEATVIARATLADGQTYDVIFVYEKGAALAAAPADGSPKVAADIRVCFGFHLKCHPVFNENAYALFEAAINYALGMTPPPALAAWPRPRDGATDAQQQTALTWKPGVYVEGLSPAHRVFFSENFDDVKDGIGGIEQDVARYPIDGSLSLDLLKTYYWRVDEANSTTGWDAGPIWQFTVVDYFVVDDFESYNDLDPNDPASKRIFRVWVDGWEQPTNGSLVGYENVPFCEQTIVHGGKQSMPFFYNNTGGATYSEAELPLSPLQDQIAGSVKTLSLWFFGDASNTAAQIYVKLNGSKVTYDGDASNLTRAEWQVWNIDLVSFGINLQNVTKLSIGIDGVGASGKLFFDDIRLYAPAPEPEAP